MTEPTQRPEPAGAQPGGAQPGGAQPGEPGGHPAEQAQPKIVRPYGDTTGDGRVQVSFTLPIPFGTSSERARAEGAALQLAGKMGLEPAMVVHAKGVGSDFTFFIVYGRVGHLVDLSEVVVTEREFPLLSPAEVNLRIRSGLGRKLVVVGACIGTDAHTVGIDAILNVKGHAGEKGLEYYREIRVVNLGSQVEVPTLVARARAEGADAVLVSQVVTQRDAHVANAREMASAFDAAGPGRPLLVVGGPRFDPAMIARLGVDKIFGKGTTPSEVASYLAYALTPAPPASPAEATPAESPSAELRSGEPPSGEPLQAGPHVGAHRASVRTAR
jgi:beta-lysine 5,6-aminomutase beta subunit